MSETQVIKVTEWANLDADPVDCPRGHTSIERGAKETGAGYWCGECQLRYVYEIVPSTVAPTREGADYAPGYVTPEGLPEATFIGATANGEQFTLRTDAMEKFRNTVAFQIQFVIYSGLDIKRAVDHICIAATKGLASYVRERRDYFAAKDLHNGWSKNQSGSCCEKCELGIEHFLGRGDAIKSKTACRNPFQVETRCQCHLPTREAVKAGIVEAHNQLIRHIAEVFEGTTYETTTNEYSHEDARDKENEQLARPQSREDVK